MCRFRLKSGGNAFTIPQCVCVCVGPEDQCAAKIEEFSLKIFCTNAGGSVSDSVRVNTEVTESSSCYLHEESYER